MKELIYNVESIFNAQEQIGCLFQYNAIGYHIPAYQRGYKWGSDKHGAVTILLSDLWNQYQKSKSSDKKEYFLQYITVKPILINEKTYLEVIDGQQRLTTLSILLSCFSALLEHKNIADSKLDYAIRENFFKDHIYQKESFLSLVAHNWETLIEDDISLNKQDIFYLFKASKKCHETLTSSRQKKELVNFYNYICAYVKIIVNSVEKHIVSETVFKNLNSNKVPLTETELIKGLFITKAGREIIKHNGKGTFQELTEKRITIGRQWDEITAWANNPEIFNLYFNDSSTDGMFNLLHVVAQLTAKNSIDVSSKKGEFNLFNYYLENENFVKSFHTIVEVKNKLESWFYNTEIYNLIGFLRFEKANKHKFKNKLLAFLTYDSIKKLKEELNALKKDILNINIDEVSYADEDSTPLHNILLAMNVFPIGQENVRFDFYSYKDENWTLEHIFPQTPEGKNVVLDNPQKEAIKQILGDKITEEINAVLALEVRDELQKEIYYKALKEDRGLNSIGNMCLLSLKDNSSNGNKFFNDKRKNILERIQRGSFVPKHTFDVFSKMFPEADTDNMKAWTGTDILKHENHIKQTINTL
ncbi:DUF262 domain-containing protein [Tenacibaculum sp. SSH1-16]|uniref:DUF262 domain-containing protein n=1 Tax=Tenacibaculum sp. SSH1-16 TaxID=3136667 RepID=UPI0032C4AD6F